MKDICPPESLPAKKPSVLHVRFACNISRKQVKAVSAQLKHASEECTGAGLSVLASIEDDPVAEYMLPFKIRNDMELIGLLRNSTGVVKAWTE